MTKRPEPRETAERYVNFFRFGLGLMLDDIAEFLSTQVKKRISILSTVALITVRPSMAVERLQLNTGTDVRKAARFFLACVAIIIAIEAVFSFAFDTAFSDLVHNFYPIFVALLGVLTVYLFLKLLITPNVHFQSIAVGMLYVAGSALLVMITGILLLLTF